MTTRVSLCKAISKRGYASRTRASAMIRSGEITVDGIVCRNPEQLVDETTLIFHDGIPLICQEERVLLLYKPRGVITSSSDEKGRPTVYSLLPAQYQKLHCVGRLDWATSGLLLLTNNSMLSSWLTDPQSGIQRVYLVTVRGLVSPDDAQRIKDGITDKNEFLHCDNVLVRKTSKRESHLVLTLTEGKNREIRRLCCSIGHEVTRLKRVAYGNLTLGNLAPAEFREVTHDELACAFNDFYT